MADKSTATVTQGGASAGDDRILGRNAAGNSRWWTVTQLKTFIMTLVSDTTPQLGGMLDVNGQAIGDGTRELVTFTEDASAVNHVNIENEATGSGPIISAAGDDAAVDLNLAAKGAGIVAVGGSAVATLAGTQTLTNKTFDAANNTLSLTTDSVDAIAEIASAIKSGSDGTLVTGTAGTNGNLASWDANGDAIDSTVVAANVLVSGDIGSTVQGYDADTLKADTTDTLTVGYSTTPYNAGSKFTGTYTPDEANGDFQYATNDGAHTLAPPTNNCSLCIQYTNGVAAGAITRSGFTIETGDTYATTDGNDYFFYITKNNGFSHLHVVALQ